MKEDDEIALNKSQQLNDDDPVQTALNLKDILINIFSFFNRKSLSEMATVSKNWRDMTGYVISKTIDKNTFNRLLKTSQFSVLPFFSRHNKKMLDAIPWEEVLSMALQDYKVAGFVVENNILLKKLYNKDMPGYKSAVPLTQLFYENIKCLEAIKYRLFHYQQYCQKYKDYNNDYTPHHYDGEYLSYPIATQRISSLQKEFLERCNLLMKIIEKMNLLGLRDRNLINMYNNNQTFSVKYSNRLNKQ